jgi:MFS family permease
MTTLKTAMENPSLRYVMMAFAGFNVATYGTWLAMMVYAYRGGGTTETGVIGASLLLPAAVFAPFAATLGDRYRRERVLVTGYLAQGIAPPPCVVRTHSLCAAP